VPALRPSGRRSMRSAVRAIVVAAGACLLLLSAVVPAEAAPWEPRSSAARQLLDNGRATYRAGDYAAAAKLFLQSAAAEDSQNARWNAAQALASAGEWRRALELFDELANDKALPKDRWASVRGRQRVAAVFVAAEYAAEAGRWDEASETLRKLIAQTADLDRKNATRAFESVTRRRAEVEAKLRAERDASERAKGAAAIPTNNDTAAPVAPEPRLDHAPESTARPSRLSDRIAVSLVGVGLLGVGVGAGFWWHATKLEADSGTATDEAEINDLRNRADTQRTVGQIALGAGAAVLVAGVIKLAVPPDAPRPAVASVQPVRGGAMLVLGGDF